MSEHYMLNSAQYQYNFSFMLKERVQKKYKTSDGLQCFDIPPCVNFRCILIFQNQHVMLKEIIICVQTLWSPVRPPPALDVV